MAKKFKTKPNNTNLWKGLAKQTIDFHHALGELIDNSLSAGLPKPAGTGQQTTTIEITIEELDTLDIKLLICDAGTGIPEDVLAKDEDNIFNLGYAPDNQGVMNEHGFGLKNALALLTSGFDKDFFLLTKPHGVSDILGVEGPISDEMEMANYNETDWKDGLIQLGNVESGTKISVEVKREYFNSIYGRGQTFETLVMRLGEHLGVMYTKYINEGNEIYFHYKSKAATDFTKKTIPAIPVPFLKSPTITITTNTIEVEYGGNKYTSQYTQGRLDTSVKEPDSKDKLGWPYPLRIHFQGSNARCGVTIISRRKALRTGVFKEIWPEHLGDVSFNNFLGELRLGSEFSTTNTKSDIDPHSEIWQLLKETIREDYPPEKITKKNSEEGLRKKLIKMYAVTHSLSGKDKPAHKKIFSGGGEIDIYFEVSGKATCVETKVNDAKVQDVYQLEMYWDGLIRENIKIKEAILVANDFSTNVNTAISEINKKKDRKGNRYNIVAKKISEYSF